MGNLGRTGPLAAPVAAHLRLLGLAPSAATPPRSGGTVCSGGFPCRQPTWAVHLLEEVGPLVLVLGRLGVQLQDGLGVQRRVQDDGGGTRVRAQVELPAALAQ